MKTLSNIPTNKGEIILYQPDDTIRLEVTIEEDTVWLTQSQMVDLFQTSKQNVSLHINNVFKEGELMKSSVVKNYLTTANDGKVYNTAHYNLDVIISVGYRVKSKRGTQFRLWANRVLKEYLMTGFVFNQRIVMVEKFAVETGKRVTEIENEITKLKYYLETILTDFNDINEDTRLQLEMINETLADLHAKKKELDKPRSRIGYVQ
ncbi:MAG: virulence RhuM family protein [Marinilabiliaceae bacterium]|nr:virulence RhuM family protein [Marinilabiliaceae bacterium]